MERYWCEILRVIDRMGTQEWLLVLGGMIIFGLFCMKGFGSRSKY